MSAQNSSISTLTLPSDREIVMTRVFDAPRELVFKAYTDPNLIPQWWGLRSHTTTVDKMDVRPGGVWRFVQRDADGNEYAFNGEYRDGMLNSGMEDGAIETWDRLAELLRGMS